MGMTIVGWVVIGWNCDGCDGCDAWDGWDSLLLDYSFPSSGLGTPT